jgi:hypothetical protein
MTYNNDINANVTGLVKGSGTGTFSGVTVTQYNSLIGSTSNGITSVAPGSTTGVPLVSQGASANPAYAPMVVAGGGTNITSATAYGVICAGTTSTGSFQAVTPGTAGYLLESGGSSALPTWVSVGTAGNLVLIQSQTIGVGGVVINFTTGINSTYNNYFMLLSGCLNQNTSAYIIEISTNGGSSYIATGYRNVFGYFPTNSTTWTSSTDVAGQELASIGFGGGSSGVINGGVYLYNLTSGSGYIASSGKGVVADNTAAATIYWFCAGQYETASTTVNALRVYTSGTTAGGTISLFGILE